MKPKMIPALALGLLAFAVAMPVEAQRGQGRMGPSLDERVAQLTEVLSLDEAQVPQVREVLEMEAEKRRETFQNLRGSGDRGAMMTAMQELQEETRTLLAEILSEEQLEKYDAHVEEMRQRRRPLLD